MRERSERRAEWTEHCQRSVLACVSLVVLAVACGTREGDQKAAGSAPGAAPGEITLTQVQAQTAGIVVAPIELQVPKEALATTGAVAYDETRTARITPPAGGRVVQVLVDLGSRVKAGQPLCEIDSPDLAAAHAAYRTAVADLEVANKSLERAAALVEQKVISRAELELRKAAAERAQAEVERTARMLASLGVRRDGLGGAGSPGGGNRGEADSVVRLELRSPVAGVVTRRDVLVGQLVERQDALFVVSDLASVWIWLDVFERDLAAVAEGRTVRLTADAYPGVTFTGKVGFVGEVTPSTRAARIRVPLVDAQMRLRPGMFVRAKVETASGVPALLLPVDALQQVGGRTVAFRALGPLRFQPVQVTVGRRLGAFVEITSGLAAGDAIVTAGALALAGELSKGEMGEED